MCFILKNQGLGGCVLPDCFHLFVSSRYIIYDVKLFQEIRTILQKYEGRPLFESMLLSQSLGLSRSSLKNF